MEADLSGIPVNDLDTIWSELIQRGENASETWGFYEREMQDGRPVTLASLDRAQGSLCLIEAEEQPFKEEWDRRGGWLRVFSDSYGILHRSSGCGRTKAHQHPQLLPALSGWSDSQVVEHAGLAVCLTCFPGAEAHPFYRKALRDKRKQERCPGSTRKPKPQGGRALCSVCSRPVNLTPAGRARTHKK